MGVSITGQCGRGPSRKRYERRSGRRWARAPTSMEPVAVIPPGTTRKTRGDQPDGIADLSNTDDTRRHPLDGAEPTHDRSVAGSRPASPRKPAPVGIGAVVALASRTVLRLLAACGPDRATPAKQWSEPAGGRGGAPVPSPVASVSGRWPAPPRPHPPQLPDGHHGVERSAGGKQPAQEPLHARRRRQPKGDATGQDHQPGHDQQRRQPTTTPLGPGDRRHHPHEQQRRPGPSSFIGAALLTSTQGGVPTRSASRLPAPVGVLLVTTSRRQLAARLPRRSGAGTGLACGAASGNPVPAVGLAPRFWLDQQPVQRSRRCDSAQVRRAVYLQAGTSVSSRKQPTWRARSNVKRAIAGSCSSSWNAWTRPGVELANAW